ncbi:trafficking protein particle complex subunit 10 [Epithele typhae]|uniref:trafficking protein particle complex subunit 10 n=1 Tax=Epithele typhae TaxID=378194 RepID=UPI0020085039|nr:trafficking protein particle complex subunit 10 [Epithele typhae]KAH9945954.1 trafficking protein particle complex subunit 10 [Epithele typhae]
MSSQAVTITYAGPLVFLSTDHWKQIYASLLSQLPLRNLHWKSSARNALRSIQELDVKLVALETLRDDHAASQVPQTVLDKPLLNMYIFICEDSESYRVNNRKHIKEWHASVSQRKNQEWLIVHVVRPDQNVAQGRLFQMKASVLDKVKADFNADKKDRCVQLVWSAEKDSPAVWADLVTKVKDGILSAFDGALKQREDEVKRSEGQRQMPGWNFCTFFILKESVANSLEGMNLYEDSLQQYFELEEIFSQVLREKNLSWFGTLITPTPNDDSAPLLSVDKKPYRDLILANTISVFDFRIYLLSRECALLGKMGDMEELCRKAASFLSTFARTLREVENTLAPFFIESWIYSSALSVVDQSEDWARTLQLDKPALASFNAAKGELVELARHQLDILGIAAGFLPNKPPFSLALPSFINLADKSPRNRRASMDLTITRPELLSSLVDADALYDQYVSITNRAIDLYVTAGRRKFALKMHGSLAALDVHRDRLGNALQTFTSLPAHYSPHGWTSLEAFMLNRALDIHASTEKTKDREWIHILLHFLRAYVDGMGRDLLMSEEDSKVYVEGLVASLKDAAQEMDSDIPSPDHTVLSVSLPFRDATLAESRDGALLGIVVQNKLPCALPVDEVEVQLGGRDNTKITFTVKVASLAPGLNKLTAFCPSSAPGTYALFSTQITMSRLLFQWKHTKTAKQIRAGNLPTLVHIPKDHCALDVKLKQPPRIELGIPSRAVVVLSTGRNEVASAVVKLGAPSGVTFKYAETEMIGDDPPPFRTENDCVMFLDIKPGQTVAASIPHSDASAYHYMKVTITVDYVTTSEQAITRTLRLNRMIATSLPVAINVEDFFRGTRLVALPTLFTMFTLSTTSHQHVRVKTTQLSSQSESSGVKVTGCTAQKPSVVTITPVQPGRFLFQMDSIRGQVREGLKLHIMYRMLREEVESLVELAVKEAVAEDADIAPHRQDIVDKLVQSLESSATWVELYGVTGELVPPGVEPSDDQIGKGLRRALEILKQKRTPISFGDWREIVIPVDVPQMHILAAARLQILENPVAEGTTKTERRKRPLYAGQPISALLAVQTSFHWAPLEDKKVESYHMRYEVEDLINDWLVSGRKRGDFTARVSHLHRDGETLTVPVTLIALHHGELALPKISVTALPIIAGGEHRMRSSVVPGCDTHQVHGAEKVLVLPRGGRTTFVVNMGNNDAINPL